MKSLGVTGFLFATIMLSSSAYAMTEVYHGQSEIGDEDTGKVCTLTLERDDKSTNILSIKLEAPARLIKLESGEDELFEDITTGKETRDLSRTKKFSEFHFQRLPDVQGDGFVLHGEKIEKSKKDEKLFLHFDVLDHSLVGVQLEQRETRPPNKLKTGVPERISIEKLCSNLKKL